MYVTFKKEKKCAAHLLSVLLIIQERKCLVKDLSYQIQRNIVFIKYAWSCSKFPMTSGTG